MPKPTQESLSFLVKRIASYLKLQAWTPTILSGGVYEVVYSSTAGLSLFVVTIIWNDQYEMWRVGGIGHKLSIKQVNDSVCPLPQP